MIWYWYSIGMVLVQYWYGIGTVLVWRSACWQERRGGTASGLSCCQLNTALIDDEGDSDGGEDGHMLMGRG